MRKPVNGCPPVLLLQADSVGDVPPAALPGVVAAVAANPPAALLGAVAAANPVEIHRVALSGNSSPLDANGYTKDSFAYIGGRVFLIMNYYCCFICGMNVPLEDKL